MKKDFLSGRLAFFTDASQSVVHCVDNNEVVVATGLGFYLALSLTDVKRLLKITGGNYVSASDGTLVSHSRQT